MNLALLMCESALHFLPSIWIMFAVVFFEGLLGGTAFVNTFYRISVEVGIPKMKQTLNKLISWMYLKICSSSSISQV